MQSKDLQLQIEQTMCKEETFPAKDVSRTTKKRSSKSARRSPYPPQTPTDYSSSSAQDYTASAEYSPDNMASSAIPQGSYPSMFYPQADAMDSRYASLYSSYGGLYGDMSMYPYGAYHRYMDRTGQYDEKYYSRDAQAAAYTSYLASQAQGDSSRVMQSPDSQESPSCQRADSATAAQRQYESCIHSVASRSSSRDATSFSQSHHYPPPYSSARSESSTSEGETGIQEDFKDRKNSAAEDPMDTSSSRVFKSPEAGKLAESAGPAQHQSVIMRPGATAGARAHAPSTTHSLNVSSNCSQQNQEGTKATPSANAPDSRTAALDSSRNNLSSSYTANQCNYENFKQGSYQGTVVQSHRPSSYPVMPQPGYTSVIVDTQQYHMANGYVH